MAITAKAKCAGQIPSAHLDLTKGRAHQSRETSDRYCSTIVEVRYYHFVVLTGSRIKNSQSRSDFWASKTHNVEDWRYHTRNSSPPLWWISVRLFKKHVVLDTYIDGFTNAANDRRSQEL
jgi:hypothetical protein